MQILHVVELGRFRVSKGKGGASLQALRVRTIQETHGAEECIACKFSEACGSALSLRVLQAVCTEADDAVMHKVLTRADQ